MYHGVSVNVEEKKWREKLIQNAIWRFTPVTDIRIFFGFQNKNVSEPTQLGIGWQWQCQCQWQWQWQCSRHLTKTTLCVVSRPRQSVDTR